MALIVAVEDLTHHTDQCSFECSLQQNRNTFHHQSSRAEHNMKIHRVQKLQASVEKPSIQLEPPGNLEYFRNNLPHTGRMP